MTDVRSLLDEALSGFMPNGDDPEPAIRRGRHRRRNRRVVAAVVATVVFIAGGTASWVAFRPVAGSSGPSVLWSRSGSSPLAPAATDRASALAKGRWSVLPTSPIGPRIAPTMAWGGGDVFEVGGHQNVRTGGRIRYLTRRDVASFDVSTSTWRRQPPIPPQVGAENPAVAWTGHSLFVYGGWLPDSHPTACCYGASVDPASGRWVLTAPAPLDPMDEPTVVRIGGAVIVAGLAEGSDASTATLEAAAYEVATGRWISLDPPVAADHRSMGLAMVATDDDVFLWSLWARTPDPSSRGFPISAGVDVFRLSRAGTWAEVTGAWPQDHTVDGPVWTGSGIVLSPGQIWCGPCPHPAPHDEHGLLVDPHTLRVRPMAHDPIDDVGPAYVWTGAAVLSLNVSGEISGPDIHVAPGDLAIWDPATGSWTAGPRAPRQPGSEGVWGGHRLFAMAEDGTLMAFGA
jgi:hypothetical protein